jgi:hypothetical protein
MAIDSTASVAHSAHPGGVHAHKNMSLYKQQAPTTSAQTLTASSL